MVQERTQFSSLTISGEPTPSSGPASASRTAWPTLVATGIWARIQELMAVMPTGSRAACR